MTNWSDSEAPSTSHDPTRFAHNPQQQQQQEQFQHSPNQPHLHTQQGESYADDDYDYDKDSDDGDAFAYGPLSRADQPPQPHQIHYSQNHQNQQYRSQDRHLTARKLHDLVVAAGLSTCSPPPPSDLTLIPEPPTVPNSYSPYAHNHYHHYHQPETWSYEHKADLGSCSMYPIPVSPGILEPQYRPLPDFITNPNILPSNPRVSALETSSRSLTGSPISTQVYEEDSPYAEVRASVGNMDDPEMPTTTFRMWFLGLTLVLVGSCLNIFLNFRFPAPFISPSIVLLMAYPLGKALEYILPTRT